VEGLTDQLIGHVVVGLDTALFIYHLQGTREFVAASRAVLRAIHSGAIRGVTSVVTVMEVTVLPLRLQQTDAAMQYESAVLEFPNLYVADITLDIARKAAALRATYRIATADALQLAAAIEHGATAFITNDRLLRRVNDIDIVLLGDLLR
jgi:predicted nucleic acid-binding protein